MRARQRCHVCVLLGRAGSEQRGAELVEFAFILPLLLTFLLGIVWMGRAYNVYQTITRAAREGARYAVLPSCASCGDAYIDTYTAANSCLANPTNAFTNAVSPALTASGLDPAQIPSTGNGVYCQEALVLNPNTDNSVQQCGVAISFGYPLQLIIPFTSLNATTLTIKTQVQMRMENQSVDNTSGNPQCPGVN